MDLYTKFNLKSYVDNVTFVPLTVFHVKKVLFKLHLNLCTSDLPFWFSMQLFKFILVLQHCFFYYQSCSLSGSSFCLRIIKWSRRTSPFDLLLINNLKLEIFFKLFRLWRGALPWPEPILQTSLWYLAKLFFVYSNSNSFYFYFPWIFWKEVLFHIQK